MSSFLSSASKKVTDIRGFLRDAAGGTSIKYVAEKGTKHLVYFPYQEQVEGDNKVKVPIAISGNVHEWQSPDGKFKSTVCMQDMLRKAEDGTVLNDGTCPFCDRVSDAWDIYNYRKEKEENECTLTGEDRKKHLEKTFATYADERKAKTPRAYMYILVAKFHMDSAGNPVIGSDNLPEYDLKVMKLSASRMEKIQQQMANSGSELPDSEVIFEYPAVDDKRLQVSQSTTAPVFPNNKYTVRYAGLLDKIKRDVDKFDWEGIPKAFPEWAGMTVEGAKAITDGLFEKWDEYRERLKVDPNAKYLEYSSNTPVTQPSLGGMGAPIIPGVALPTGEAPAIPNVPTAPVIPGVAVPTAEAPAAPAIPTAPAAPAAPAAPSIPEAPAAPVDPNAVFNGVGNLKI